VIGRTSVKLRIVLGLVCLLASILLIGAACGLVPDRQSAVLEGRGALCEALAVHCSTLISRGDLARLEKSLNALAGRGNGLVHAAVRQSNGKVVAQGGESVAVSDSDLQPSLLSVPVWSGNQKWGSVEVRFEPLSRGGLLGRLLSPTIRLVLFACGTSFLAFVLYLGRVLQYLDPTKVVPQRVRSALDTLAEGLILLDKKGRIVLANRAFPEKLGLNADKLQGRKASTLPWIHSGLSSELPWVKALEGSPPDAASMLGFSSGDCGRKTFQVHAAPVVGEDGGLRGALASFEDVTLLEEKERELQVSKEVAEAASRAKGDFLARMSHEIRTPLNAVLGFTDVLRRGLEESEVARREYLDTIHTSGKHLLDLINDVLDLSKIESGRLEIERIRCSPLQVASEVVAVLRARAAQKGIGLALRSAGKVPETILTDPGRLRQVLMNLAGNAIKFTERGTVEIVLRFDSKPTPSVIAFDVIDTGIGIPPEGQQRIFEPFTQADSTITRRFGGTGLGLAISKQFAEALGGGITLRSAKGKGSVFTATVETGPLDDVKLVDLAGEAPLIQAEVLAAPVLRLPRARILLVEDGESNRRLVSLVLRRAGVEVETAEDGREGVERATREDFDLILMDMQMPVMDGLSATAALRERGITAPIIALTAHAMKGEEEKCRAAGCSGFITKPIDLDMLVRTVGAELRKGGLASASPAAETSPPLDSSLVERGENSAANGIAEGIRSSLDLNDPELFEIVAEFVERLRDKIEQMDQAWNAGNLEEIARLAHWLKGSAGTAGFLAFTAPALELEILAKSRRLEKIESAIERLHLFAERIVVPATRNGGEQGRGEKNGDFLV